MHVRARNSRCDASSRAGDRRHERVGVDLSMWMMQRDSDFDAAVLEGHDILHVRDGPELAVAVCPHLDDELEMIEREVRPDSATAPV